MQEGPAAPVERLPISRWQAEVLRLTAFPTPIVPAEDHGWWSHLTGEPPSSKTSRPKEGAQIEEGPFCGGRLVNLAQPNRIEWRLIPILEQDPGEGGIPTIGAVLEPLESFVNLALRWLGLETCPALWRLAFGAILFLPVDSKPLGYRVLSAYLPHVELDPEHSSDFSYQINRPRQSTSGIADLTMNRLSKWSVMSIHMMNIAVSAAAPMVRSGVTPGHIACRLELDISTGAERDEPLPQEELTRVFNELVDLGKEIATEGDIR